MNNPLPQIQCLIEKLTHASHAYYHENREIMTDYAYDELYDSLVALENETGIILSNSPTQKVGTDSSAFTVVDTLTKVPHATPMLSLDKTKSTDALANFLGSHDGWLTWKLDGLAISLTYENGMLVQALTRGNGTIGEDVTHNARVFVNIPLKISHLASLTVRGEAVITYTDFSAINAALPAEEAYKNPRNLCSGTVRQLNSAIAAARKVRFYAIGAADMGTLPHSTRSKTTEWLQSLGFETAPGERVTHITVAQAVSSAKLAVQQADIATDGLVLAFDDMVYGTSLGATSKFPRDAMAFKWEDELQETTLEAIEWNTSRTGLINPIAIFVPVALEGTSVSRASVHNVSVLRRLQLQVGHRITVYKANMIIPQIEKNLDAVAEENQPAFAQAEARVIIPNLCPVCNAPTEIVSGPSGDALYCTGGLLCAAQHLRMLAHFVSRDAMNIAGLSEQTLEKLVALGIVTDYTHLFTLEKHQHTIESLEGFGKKSYAKLITAIETAKDIALPNFIYALGIRHVGLANAKLLCDFFSQDVLAIINACTSPSYMEILGDIKGFGEAIAQSLFQYFSIAENVVRIHTVMPLLRLKIATPKGTQRLTGLTFVITGDVTQYKNRKELQQFIESEGGKVTGSVTGNTSYLINNDNNSPSAKNKKAASLHVPVIDEVAFAALLTDK